MNMPNVEFLNVPLYSAPMSYLVSSEWGRPLCYGPAAGVASILALWRYGQTSKRISSVSFARIESNFFYNTQETQTQKMKFQFCDF